MISIKNLLIKNERYRSVYKYLFRYKSWIRISIILSIFNTLIQIPFPIITKIIIDEVIINKKSHLVFPLILTILSIIPFMIVIPWFYRFFLFKLTHKTGIIIRKALCDHFLRLELAIFKKKGPGYFASRVFDDVDKLVGSIYQVLFPILQNVLLFVCGWVLTFYINWKLAFIPALFLPIYAFLNSRVGIRLKKENEILAEKKAKTFEFFSDMFQSVENIRYHALEQSHLISFFKKDIGLLRQNLRVFYKKTSLESLNNLMMILTPALVLIIGIFMIIEGVMTLGEYVAFTTFMTYMLGPLKFFFTSNITFQDFKVALERVSQAFVWPLSHEYLYQGKKSGFFELKKGDIEIESVNFSYDETTQKEKENGNLVLKNITLHIKQGERIVLMGKSGSGKTTLLKLIMGLYLPVMGSIRIGGQPYTRVDILRLRKHIAYIEQEPVLFKGSIGKNIVLNTQGHHDNKNKIEKAARFANAHDFIMQMEKGYDTALDRLGSNLSVGQKQRIALSRFFYKGADILILDEPTSAVDIQSTELIKESLKKVPPQKTIIMVTHDPLIAKFSDRLVIIDDGEIKRDYKIDEIEKIDSISLFNSMESGGQ